MFLNYPFAIHRVKEDALHKTNVHCDDEALGTICLTVVIAAEAVAVIKEKEAEIKRLKEKLNES